MFDIGNSYKVKVELNQGQVGFGRALIVLKEGGHLFLCLRTSKQQNQILPKGTRLWFVNDSPSNLFNGLWSTVIIGQRAIHGKTTMECASLKFEPANQRRDFLRLKLNCPVIRQRQANEKLKDKLQLKDISSSGLAITLQGQANEQIWANKSLVNLIVKSPIGDIPLTASLVHTEYNWLNNLTTVGLEITAINPDAKILLDQLLSHKGSSKGQVQKTLTADDLSHWLKGTKNNKNLDPSVGEEKE